MVRTELPGEQLMRAGVHRAAERYALEILMNILEKIKQVFIPVNQPEGFPRLYFIPETITVQAPRQACNDPSYRPSVAPQPIRQQETKIQKFIRQVMEIFQEACADAWSAIKAFGRSVVRWLVWRVFVPLSVVCALSSQLVSPMELPL
jgi:hypothetical protein